MSKRQHAILMAALACFNDKGIEATSIADIGSQADASVGSIYHHFGNKQGIAIALLVEGLRSNTQQLQSRLRHSRSARQSVRTTVTSLIDWIMDNPEWARFIYTVSSSRLMQAGAEQLEQVNTYQTRVVEEYLAIHAGRLRQLPAECLPSLILGPVHDYARRWLNGQVKASPQQHAKLFADTAWNNLSKQ